MAFVVTVDGPAGAGKSSIARRIARRLGIRYLDTGALYRAVAYHLDKRGIPPSVSEISADTLSSIAVRVESESIFINGEDVSAHIRSPRVDRVVSAYSALKAVRDALLDLQREQAKYGDLIADGRDTGTVVFPMADVKFFITASVEARAERRYRELLKKGEAVVYKEVLNQIYARDRADSAREIAPLREPEDAVHIDTSAMTENEVIQELSFIIQRGMA